MRSLINYFLKRPVLCNVLMFGMLLTAVVIWQKIGKEEMPEFAMNWVRVSIRYPGASARDVELFVTKPIEEKLKGVTGLEEVSSTSSYGSSSFRISFESSTQNISEKVQEVKDAVESVSLPREVDDPVYRQFKSSEKAIIDIGIFLKDVDILSVEDRQTLQRYVLSFKDRLLSLKEISGVEMSGYLRPELQIKIDPLKLKKFEISMAQVKEQIIQQNVRRPIGSLKDKGESEVTIISELDTVETLKNVIVTSGFQGQQIKLGQLATIQEGFEKNTSVSKVQAREGIVINIQKSSNVDILAGQKAVIKFFSEFKKNNPEAPIDTVIMDDESYDVRNRLGLILGNGILGFILIAVVLFIFLDLRAGVWVAMGIPFSLAFTLVGAGIIGYTINNMTLAAIIIVLGIVVDDAIIIAENIQRKQRLGQDSPALNGTAQVIAPIIASILTTCAAFIPLYFFSGHFGLFVKYIPTIVFLMLLASLVESILILPGHMAAPLPFENKLKSLFGGLGRKEKFIQSLEEAYRVVLEKLLPLRLPILVSFVLILAGSIYLYKEHMKFVMFPREESRDFNVKVEAKEQVGRYEMAKLITKLEEMFLHDESKVVTSVSSRIGQSRRGGEVRENEASISVEILPPDERSVSLNQLFKKWEEKVKEFPEFEKIKFLKSRWGFDSGSPIAIEIRENNDELRDAVANQLRDELTKLPGLSNVEIEKPVTKNEFKLEILKNEVSALGVNYEHLSSTLRAYVEGEILYTFNSGEEEVDVRYTTVDEKKDSIGKLLKMSVQNRENYLVPISGLVHVVEGQKPSNIGRVNYKRTIMVYADLNPQQEMTPLEVASQLEADVFPKLLRGNPSTVFEFKGEIEESRESQGDFGLSIAMALVLIYVLLVFLFDSVVIPLLIGAIIPFGLVGVILAFYFHGMYQYGFFAMIGAIGMIGVVINDSIVLIDKMKTEPMVGINSRGGIFEKVASITASRLRAVVVTTLTTVAGLFPTAYGFSGYDSMLAEMMLALGWGLLFGMFITLLLVPCIYSYYLQILLKLRGRA